MREPKAIGCVCVSVPKGARLAKVWAASGKPLRVIDQLQILEGVADSAGRAAINAFDEVARLAGCMAKDLEGTAAEATERLLVKALREARRSRCMLLTCCATARELEPPSQPPLKRNVPKEPDEAPF